MRTARGMLPTLLKLGVFVLVTVLCTVLVVNTLRRPLGEPTVTYHAVFTNVLGLEPGSDVRMAGVRVGRVNTVRLGQNKPRVTFEVTADHRLPADVHAVIRYADLLGARYIALLPGTKRGEAGESGTRLAAEATIPLANTEPALDLTALFNGFKPVFETLRPQQVNKLAKELITVFQGKGKTINTLLSTVVSLTSSITAQDRLIGELLANLRPVLNTTLGHTRDFRALVSGLDDLLSGLAEDRDLIIGTLRDVGAVTSMVADLVRDMQPALNHDLAALHSVAGTWLEHKEAFTKTLRQTPEMLRTLLRTLDYGSWVNVYLCNLNLNLAGQKIDTGAGPHSKVCRP